MATTQAERTQAFAKFYEQNYGWVYRYLKSQVGLVDVASDLAQETFVRLYEWGRA